ncbi:probable electron transfer flavoprotein beta subunit lysine methyltransferase [Coccomyxa sp. Obi]|nr:probable electron transfer flavoprotein beta subunit lysine methyltransferase [Coccomyxa sp. Obi]
MLLRHGLLSRIALPRSFVVVTKAVRPYSIRTVGAARAVNELQFSHPPSREDFNGRLLPEKLGTELLALQEQRLQVGSQELVLVEPADVDAVMDMYIKRGQMDRDPYWSRPWPSAVALAKLILQQPSIVSGRRVCEVGAGLGIASIAAALAGAKEVVMTDREPLALQCALRSASASGIGSVADFQGTSFTKHSSRPQVRGELLDWTQPYVGQKFDVVVACDVLYEDFSVEPVGELLPQLLSSSGCVLLADPSERTRHNREYFVDMMQTIRRPMLLEECRRVDEEMDGKVYSIELMRFRFKEGSESVGVKTLRR